MKVQYGPTIRVWKRTHERLRKRAFKEGKSMTKLIDELAEQKPLKVSGTVR
jgi:hypothetical protein